MISSNLNVLLIGETGTGKELIFKAIRDGLKIDDSKCREINCAELKGDMIASELFGHVRGAFTGAIKDRDGLLKSCEGGVIFLDELGSLDEDSQAKLLRVIQECEIRKVGSDKTVKLKNKIRVIAATNEEKNLRTDLKWRFEKIIQIPPLRERREDILVLVIHV